MNLLMRSCINYFTIVFETVFTTGSVRCDRGFMCYIKELRPDSSTASVTATATVNTSEIRWEANQ